MHRLHTVVLAASPARSIPSSCINLTSKLQPHLRSPSHTTPSSMRPRLPQQHHQLRTFSHTHVLPTSTQSQSPFRLTSKPQPEQPTPETPPEGSEAYYSPHKPKRHWPPDMSKLSPKHQFRLERKYRRRAALKYARPKWTKATKLVQWGSIGFVLLYALLFMPWDERGSPFDEIRKHVFAGLKGAFSAPPSPGSVRRAEDSVRE